MSMRQTGALLCWLAALAAVAGEARGQAAQEESSEVNCLIQPKSIAKLGSPVVGILAEVAVDRGDTVKVGQVLFRLRSGVERAAVDLARAKAQVDARIQSARARLEFQTRKLQRGQELVQKKFMSQSSFDEAQRDKRVAELDLREAKAEQNLAALELARAEEILAQRTVRSPVGGVVMEVSMSAGEYVHEQASVLTIARLDVLHVEAFLPVSRYGTLKPGMRLEVRPDPPIGGSYFATVSVVDRVLDAASGTFGIRLDLPNPGYRLPGGIRCKLSVPAAATPRRSG